MSNLCDKSMGKVYPHLLEEWSYKQNKGIDPFIVSHGSSKKVWWTCKKCNHEWATRISHRKEGSGCPKCARNRHYYNLDKSLKESNPILVKEWHSTKNLPLTPDQIGRGSEIKVWWICKKGHEWQAVVYSRVNGNKCPYCSGFKVNDDNCLANNFPRIAKQWHPTKNGNLTPKQVTKGTHKRVWWLGKCRHEWQAHISTRTSQKTGCPYCNRFLLNHDHNLLISNPNIAKQWHPTKNRNLTPKDVTPLSNTSVWWLCDKGHEWKTRISHRSRGSSNCPYCSKVKLKDGTFFHSLTEAFWYLKFKNKGLIFYCNNMYNSKTKDEIGKCKYDFYFPKYNLYVEVTSFGKEWRNWEKYLKKIDLKKKYVENKLKAKFVFIQYVLNNNDRKWVQKHIENNPK